MKFKKGQKVKFLGYRNANGTFSSDNSPCKNREGVISYICLEKGVQYPYSITFDNKMNVVSNLRENEIESLNTNPNCNVIRV